MKTLGIFVTLKERGEWAELQFSDRHRVPHTGVGPTRAWVPHFWPGLPEVGVVPSFPHLGTAYIFLSRSHRQPDSSTVFCTHALGIETLPSHRSLALHHLELLRSPATVGHTREPRSSP